MLIRFVALQNPSHSDLSQLVEDMTAHEPARRATAEEAPFSCLLLSCSCLGKKHLDGDVPLEEALRALSMDVRS